MKAFVAKIGLISKTNVEHSVSFLPGVNVVTGRSSTGKSALIEIFNYCFGASQNNIPFGEISSEAELYFVVFKFENFYLLLGRYPDQKRAFIQSFMALKDRLTIDDFSPALFIPLEDFKEALGGFFGLEFEDIEENLEERKYRGKRKPSPSVRLFLAYMIQTQNLVASKNLLFYGFEDTFRREQTIDQFSIVSGFVNQKYFYDLQRLNHLKAENRTLSARQKYAEERGQENRKRLAGLLSQFAVLTGRNVNFENVQELLCDLNSLLQRKDSLVISMEEESKRSLKKLDEIKKKINTKYAAIRDLNRRIRELEETKNISKSIEESFSLAKLSGRTYQIYKSRCPFCLSPTENVSNEANKLIEAIKYLNQELSVVPSLEKSFEKEKHRLIDSLNNEYKELKSLESEKDGIVNVSDELRKNYSLNEQALWLLYKIRIVAEEEKVNVGELEEQLKFNSEKIEELQESISQNFKVKEKMEDATEYLNDQINEIANKLGFEDSYKPLNFKFDLHKFELTTKVKDRRVSVKQMGSAANWLYCHLSLFMSFTRYFAFHKDTALVPPILFLDQPSQAYFPSLDTHENFKDAFQEEESHRTNQLEKVREQSAKEDLEEVNNFFNQIVLFNKETLNFTGYEPQIIITEHADHLKLDSCEFESLVRARWRTQDSGLIDRSNLSDRRESKQDDDSKT